MQRCARHQRCIWPGRVCNHHIMTSESTTGPVHFIAHFQVDDAEVYHGYEKGFFPVLKPYGARFLKRVIDERIKIPLSQQWRESAAFRVRVRAGRLVVESSGGRRLAKAAGPDAVAV